MGDSKSIKQAQDAVKQILEVLRVARVVCVDDIYDNEPQLEDVIVSALDLDASRLREFLPELGDSIPDDQDVLRERIRHLWDVLDKPIRSDRAARMLAATRAQDEAGTDDRKNASILDELIPQEMLLLLSPTQWEERRDQLLEEDATQRMLFLFDQDFSSSGGDAEGGIKIIASLLAHDDPGNRICGLLTHTVTPENQPERWMELSNTYSIPRDRFLVVPKQHLQEDPVLFAQRLKLVALSPDFSALKEKTKKIISDAASTAAKRIEAISIYDLDHMVFKTSAEEGLWEPDMLFRLHSLFHRLESRRLAHEGGEIETIARRLRSVSHIPTGSIPPTSSTWKIQQDDLYEGTEYVNKNHLPLELGDIFTKTDNDSQKYYILLAQPCDLMVRKNGKRAPEVVHVPVADVVSASPASSLPRYVEEMEYFGNGPNERWCVKLNRISHVRVCVLDLCVFNDDGTTTMWLDGEAPDAIRPAWKARYTILANWVSRPLNRLDLLSPAREDSQDVKSLKGRLRSELTGDLLNEGLFKSKLVNQNGRRGIAYNCRRVGRLSRARAFGLLTTYTGCLGRPAYDRDFV